MTLHKRSTPALSAPLEEGCTKVCASRVIEGVKGELEALCSVDGLQATRE